MAELSVTLNDIRQHSPCENGWKKLLAGLGKTKADDDPVSLRQILEINGLGDALWCLCALPEKYQNDVRLLACDLAEPALKYAPEGEDRPRKAIEMARRFARGDASKEELAAARDAAWASGGAAGVAAGDVAWDAAGDIAGDATWISAWIAVWIASRAEQEKTFLQWLDEMEAR